MSGAEESRELHLSPIRVSGSELIRQLSLRKVDRKKTDQTTTPSGSVKRKPSVAERKSSLSERKPSVTERKASVTERKASVTEGKLSVSERKSSVSERNQARGRLVRQSTTAASWANERASQRRRQLRQERHWHSCESDPATLDISVIHLSQPEVSAVPSSRKPSVEVNSVDRSGSQKSTYSVRPGSARYSKTPTLEPNDHVVLILAANQARESETKEHQDNSQNPRHRARVIVILTTLFLLMTCLLLVGITLRLAPLIDEIGELDT